MPLGNFGWTEILLILVVALVIFGPGKLPEVGKAMGKTIREFKMAVNKIDTDIKKEVDDIKDSVNVDEIKTSVNAEELIKAATVEETARVDLAKPQEEKASSAEPTA